MSVAHDGSSTVSLRAASTSGSSTKVSVYRIGLSRGEGSSSAVATLDLGGADWDSSYDVYKVVVNNVVPSLDQKTSTRPYNLLPDT